MLTCVTAMLVMLSGCNEIDSPVTITKINIIPESVELMVGETIQMEVISEPVESDVPLMWTSNNPDVVTVSEDGFVEAISAGDAIVTVSAGDVFAEASVKVSQPDPILGDYYYSDGTWSSEIDPEKTVIGVVFWVGDPTVDDPALKSDFPDCTHGLVVASGGDVPSYWQSQCMSCSGNVGEWVAANIPDLIPVSSNTGFGDPLNMILGYNNTKALELYNAAPENMEWPVEVMDVVDAYRSEVPAPEVTSGWYLPSIKELSLLCSGDVEGNIYDISGETSVRDLVNGKLEAVNAVKLSASSFYWSSTENSIEYSFDIDFSDGSIYLDLKFMNDPVRCVLAF